MTFFGRGGGEAYGWSLLHFLRNIGRILEQNKISFVNDHDIVFGSSEVELGVVLNLFGKSAVLPVISKLFAIALKQRYIGDQEVDSLNSSRSQKHEFKSCNDAGLADSRLQFPHLSLARLKS